MQPGFSSPAEVTDDVMAQYFEYCRLQLRLATEQSTMPLTLLAALEACYPDIAQNDRLNIHIVGAGRDKFYSSRLLKRSYTDYRQRKCSISLASPQKDGQFPQGRMISDIFFEREAYESRGWEYSVTLYQNLYQKYANNLHYKRPDLAILFHSGQSQEEETVCTYDETADGLEYCSRSTRKLVLDCLKMKDHSKGTLALGWVTYMRWIDFDQY